MAEREPAPAPAGAWLGGPLTPAQRGASAWASLREACGVVLLAERGRLALWLPIALFAGILLYFGLRTEPDPAWRWAPLPPLLLTMLLRRRLHAAWAAGLVTAAALGFATASWHAGRQPALLVPTGRATVLTGVVASVDPLPEGRRLTLDGVRLAPDAPRLARAVRVRLRSGDATPVAPGDLIRVRTLLRPPLPPAAPGAWDYQRAAYFSGLGASGTALGPVERTPGTTGLAPLAALRATLEARVAAALPGASGAISIALLTGGTGAIPPDALAAMRDSGLAHLLSVSGLHVAIVMGLSLAMLRYGLAMWRPLALRLPTKIVAALGALGVGFAYMVLTGSQVPMQRSLATAVLVTLAIVTGRRALSLRALALAAAGVALLQPIAVLGPSFQMSFAAVLALIVGLDWARPHLATLRGEGAPWRRAAAALAALVATSVLAGLATTPYGLHHFGRLQLYGVAANAVAVPLTSVLVMPAGMAAVALLPFGLERLALVPMGWGVDLVLATARTVAGWPGAAITARPLPGWGLALTSLGLVWLCVWRTRWRALGFPLMLLGAASPGLDRPPDLLVSGDGRLIALRADGVAYVQQLPGGSGFALEGWLRSWGLGDAAELPISTEPAEAALRCTPGACELQPTPGGPLAVLLRGTASSTVCGRAAVLVSSEPIRERCAGTPYVDRFSVWRAGAHAIWLRPDGAEVVSDRAYRGTRPWVPPPPRPRAPSEPPAPLDDG